MASKGFTNSSLAVIIVLGLFASCVHSQGPSNSEAPMSSEAPRTSKAPMSSESPRSSKAPTSSEAPRSSKAPRSSEAPRTFKAPRSSEAPRTFKAPMSSEAPRTSKAPMSSEAPRTSKAPMSSEAPRTSKAPMSSEAPRSSEAPGGSEGGPGGPVNEFCHTSDHKDFCTKMVRGATTLQDATRNVVLSTLDIAIELQKMYPLLEPALKDLAPQTKKSVLDTCRENFETTVDDLKDCLGFVEKNDKGSLNVHLSAATSSDCSDAFEGSAEMPQPIKDKLEVMYQAADNCLAVSEQI